MKRNQDSLLNNTDQIAKLPGESGYQQYNRLYKRNGIENIPFFQQENGFMQKIDHYPTSTTNPCNRCMGKITGIPIYYPKQYRMKYSCYLLSSFPVCSPVCAKSKIIDEEASQMAPMLSLLFSFLKTYFDFQSETIPYVALEALKRWNPESGLLTDEEYQNLNGSVYFMKREPPFLFAETWLESNITKKKLIDKSNIKIQKTNEEHQKRYEEKMKKVVQQMQEKKSAMTLQRIELEHTTIPMKDILH